LDIVVFLLEFFVFLLACFVQATVALIVVGWRGPFL
jgi:hypothetical protein